MGADASSENENVNGAAGTEACGRALVDDDEQLANGESRGMAGGTGGAARGEKGREG